MKRLCVLFAMVACSKAESPKPETPTKDDGPGVAPRAPEIKVELAGVNLADDCGDGVPTKPLMPPPAKTAASSASMPAAGSSSQPAADMPAPNAKIAAGACAPGAHCGGIPQPACEQTAMQLQVFVPDGASPTKLQIKNVEVLQDGKSVGTLTARAPSRWDGSSTYVPWDEAVSASGGGLVASYKLSAPDWNKIANGGRWAAAGKQFTLRVTVAISNKDRTIEKQSIVVVAPEPAVAT